MLGVSVRTLHSSNVRHKLSVVPHVRGDTRQKGGQDDLTKTDGTREGKRLHKPGIGLTRENEPYWKKGCLR